MMNDANEAGVAARTISMLIIAVYPACYAENSQEWCNGHEMKIGCLEEKKHKIELVPIASLSHVLPKTVKNVQWPRNENRVPSREKTQD
jgi:hypothetical protein